MTEHLNQSDDLTGLREEFERRWQQSERPAIEEFLEQVPPTRRTRLLVELVAVDARHRTMSGLPVDRADYLTRFPDAKEALRDALFPEARDSDATAPTVTSVSFSERTHIQVGSGTVGSAGSVAPESTIRLDASNPAAGMQIGTYRLEKRIGTGGMGTVWRAVHLRLEKTVALKLLSPQLVSNADLVARFDREMKAVGRLDHPHLVRAYDAGDERGIPYLAIEFIDGPDLSQLVREEGPLAAIRAVELIRQAAIGLDAAHSRGLIHRDIKPGNMMLTSDGQLKITDLGLARLQVELAAQETDALTLRGQILGTPDYMAPEQWDDTHAVDGRCDLYALGCTLFFLLVGKPPYATTGHTTLLAKRNAHFGVPVPDLCSLAPQIPECVASVYTRLMAKDPDDRYSSAAELVRALDELLAKLRDPEFFGSTTQVLGDSHGTGGGPSLPSERSGVSGASPLRGNDSARTQWFSVPRLSLAAVVVAVVVFIGLRSFGPGSLPSATSSETSGSASPQPAPVAPTSGDVGGLKADLPPTRIVPGLAISPFDSERARRHQQEWADYLGLTVEKDFPLGDGEALRMVLIPPGEYMMGSTDREQDRVREMAGTFKDPRDEERVRSEGPRHLVRISQPFYLSKYEVTVGQFSRFIKSTGYRTDAERNGQGGYAMLDGVWKRDPSLTWNGKFPKGPLLPSHPVVFVSCDDAEEFCKWMSKREPGVTFVLPTEAQWEYACRAGSRGMWSSGDDAERLNLVAWRGGWGGKGDGLLHPVGQLQSNSFGLRDMHGNVSEWCADWYAADAYTTTPTEDPVVTTGDVRVHRGGVSVMPEWDCRSARRIVQHPKAAEWFLGFRPAARIHIGQATK